MGQQYYVLPLTSGQWAYLCAFQADRGGQYYGNAYRALLRLVPE